MRTPKILDLDKRRQVQKEIERYLKLECPIYLGSPFVSAELLKDLKIPLFRANDAGRVLVYDVKLKDDSDAFGTIGGMLYPLQAPYSTVFSKKQVRDADVAASMHFYKEARIRFNDLSNLSRMDPNKTNLECLADTLNIPSELRDIDFSLIG